MSDRKAGHEQFKDLFKKGSKEQTTVHVAGKEPGRSRSSSNTGKGRVRVAHSKSEKRTSGGRGEKKGEDGAKAGRKKNTSNQSANSKERPESSHNSNRRATKKSPNRKAKTPNILMTPPLLATPPVTPRTGQSRPATPKKKATPKKFGPDVHEITLMQNTVFENEVGGPTPLGGRGGDIKLAQARIKERKLQWKREEISSPAKTDPRQSEPSSASNEECEKKYSKEGIREANVTVRQRTTFENDIHTPAAVKDEGEKLQWIPGSHEAAHECMSEPAVRKKVTPDERQQRALSDRPPRDIIKPLRLPVARTPERALSDPASSPVGRPLMLKVTTGTTTTVEEGFGQTANAAAAAFGTASPVKAGSAEREKPVSCYIAPTMLQGQQTNGQKNSDSGGTGGSPGFGSPARSPAFGSGAGSPVRKPARFDQSCYMGPP